MGIGESTLDDALGELMHYSNPTIGLAAHTAQADVRITARASTVAEADEMLDRFEARIRERVGPYIYSSTAEEPFEAVVAGLSKRFAVECLLWRRIPRALSGSGCRCLARLRFSE